MMSFPGDAHSLYEPPLYKPPPFDTPFPFDVSPEDDFAPDAIQPLYEPPPLDAWPLSCVFVSDAILLSQPVVPPMLSCVCPPPQLTWVLLNLCCLVVLQVDDVHLSLSPVPPTSCVLVRPLTQVLLSC